MITGTTNPCLSRPKSSDEERVHHICQISKTEDLSLDVFDCHPPFAEYSVNIFLVRSSG